MITLFSVEVNLPENSQLNRGMIGAEIFIQLWNLTYPIYNMTVNKDNKLEMLNEVYNRAIDNLDIIHAGGIREVARRITVNWNRVIYDPYLSKFIWSFISGKLNYDDFSNPVTLRISNVK